MCFSKTNADITATSGKAVQIVQHLSKTRFKVNQREVDKIFGDIQVADLPLIVLCIAGAARKGKSFLLNFFLDYLIHKEQHPEDDWVLDDTTKLAGFEFKEGECRTTLGIWAWNHVFVIEQANGKKVAICLLDSQGTFDNQTSYQDCSTIFAMTCLFSSIMCFNVFTDLQEDKLNDLATFVDHGMKVVENLGGSEKLFQDLVFIVRDFCYKKYLTQKNGGQKYIEKVLDEVDDEELQKTRDILNASYERRFGFVFPHPGKIVALEKTSNISEIDADFVKAAKTMVEKLLSPDNLQVKKLGLSEFRSKDMCEYIPQCVQSFEANKEFAPQSVQAINREFVINLEVKRAMNDYVLPMNEAFKNCETGYPVDELLKRHETLQKNVKENVLERIKNDEISVKVIEKIMDCCNKVFERYSERNTLLLKKEEARLELVEKERQHQEQLAREKAEAEAKLEAEKREHDRKVAEIEAQKERDRLEHQRKAAEMAAIAEKERIAHEREQARLKQEQENERRRVEAERREYERKQAELEAERRRERERAERLEAQLLHSMSMMSVASSPSPSYYGAGASSRMPRQDRNGRYHDPYNGQFISNSKAASYFNQW